MFKPEIPTRNGTKRYFCASLPLFLVYTETREKSWFMKIKKVSKKIIKFLETHESGKQAQYYR